MTKTIDNKLNSNNRLSTMKKILLSCLKCHQIPKQEVIYSKEGPTKMVVYDKHPIDHPNKPSKCPITYVEERIKYTCACGSRTRTIYLISKESRETICSLTAQADIEKRRGGEISYKKFPG